MPLQEFLNTQGRAVAQMLRCRAMGSTAQTRTGRVAACGDGGVGVTPAVGQGTIAVGGGLG